jgi:3-deoxy-D-manno-octulosonic-acid transferase
LEPDIIIYVHSDLWPNLIIETSKLDIPQILISGTLSSSSKRLSPFARGFYGHLYSLLHSIAAISNEDAERLRKYGHNKNIFTAGDTRFDQVLQRINNSTVKLPDILASATDDFIIAGSTWPEDETLVIPGFGKLLKNHPNLKLILVPHEPTLKRLDEIKANLENEELGFYLLSSLYQITSITNPVIVADGVGYLAELYRFGCIAYVGGSFTTGVHNVMEPSVFSLPTIFGPRIDNSYEALKLVSIGSGTVVRTSNEFTKTVERFLEDRKLLKETGEKAAKFIRSNRGASEKCFELISKTIDLKSF